MARRSNKLCVDSCLDRCSASSCSSRPSSSLAQPHAELEQGRQVGSVSKLARPQVLFLTNRKQSSSSLIVVAFVLDYCAPSRLGSGWARGNLYCHPVPVSTCLPIQGLPYTASVVRDHVAALLVLHDPQSAMGEPVFNPRTIFSSRVSIWRPVLAKFQLADKETKGNYIHSRRFSGRRFQVPTIARL